MSAKQKTFEILDGIEDGRIFSGYDLAVKANKITGEVHYPDTYLRYCREYRKKTGRQIANINKAKSLYRIGV